MDSKGHLFDEFPATGKAQWIQQVIKDLKGGDFDTVLKYTTADGIEIAPFYTQEDLSDSNTGQPLFTHTDWEVCEEIAVNDELSANKAALHLLENGVTALLFKVNAPVNIDGLLQGIGIEYIGLQFAVTGDINEFDEQLASYISGKGLSFAQLDLSVCYDPINTMIEQGNGLAIEAFMQHIITTKGCRNVVVNGPVYHNAGATPAYELGCILAHANEYLNQIGDNSFKLQANIATGPDYFFEIAKLRALRKVFALLLDAYGNKQPIYVHTESAERNLTLYDDYNNLLRTTTEAMSSTIGGCNSLVVKPFDFVYNTANEFSSRLARNIQLILKAESFFDKVADVSAGSFFIEKLTEELASKAWAYFLEIEKEGGFIACFEKGIIQDNIAGFADKQQQKFNAGKEVLVGTNKYPDSKQKMKDKLVKLLAGDTSVRATIRTLHPVRLSTTYEEVRLAQEAE